MGQIPKKYHVIDDGSFTSMGNAELRNVPTLVDSDAGERCQVILESAGKQKLLVLKTITELTNYSLKNAKVLTDYLP